MKGALLALLASTGCAQLLGLDDTKFNASDANVDAPSVCDGAPMCTSTTGRSVCGQLVGTGLNAGHPTRDQTFQGVACMTRTSDGPCALAVYAQPMASYFTNITTDRVQGTIDDCGRFVVPDLPASIADVAVVFDGTPIQESTTLVIGRPTTPGMDTGVIATVVRTETTTQWGADIDSASPPNVAGSYLVAFDTTSSDPITVRVNGVAVNRPPTQPWGVYFKGMAPFGDLDLAAAGTAAGNGSALVIPTSGAFRLDGQRPGKTCGQAMVQAVANALIHVTLKC